MILILLLYFFNLSIPTHNQANFSHAQANLSEEEFVRKSGKHNQGHRSGKQNQGHRITDSYHERNTNDETRQHEEDTKHLNDVYTSHSAGETV